MGISSVTPGRRNNKRFSYTPRYFDEAKEDLEYRVERAKREIGEIEGTDGFQERIRKGYKYGAGPSKVVNTQKAISRVRFMATATILGLIAYLIFYTDTLKIITLAFSK
jgi:hypothetical protein